MPYILPYATCAAARRGASRLPQRECDERVVLLLFLDPRVPARGDDDELLAAGRQLIRHRGGVTGRRQRALPELASGLDVERAQKRIERPGDEDEAAGGHAGAARAGRPSRPGGGRGAAAPE